VEDQGIDGKIITNTYLRNYRVQVGSVGGHL